MSVLKIKNTETGAWEPVRCIRGEDGGSGNPVPEYVTAEAERLAAVVQSHQNANTVSFIICSDLHYSTIYDAQRQKAALTHMGQAMGLLRKAVHIDFAAMLGDLFWDHGEDAATAQEEIRFVNQCLAEGFAGIPNFRTRGNHENGYESGADLSDGQIFANVGSFNSGSVYGNRLAGYCYRDFEDLKLRVICLNSSEGGGCQFSAAQIAWLNSALQLETGWRSIILSHHPLDWGKSGGESPIDTINAAEGIICALHGHIHNFKVDTISGTEVTRIAIPNGCDGRENEYGVTYGIDWSDAATYRKAPDTAEDTSFCVVTVDLTEKKIYADHYGAGCDRVVAYDDVVLATYSVTNGLSNVVSSNNSTTVTESASYTATLTANDGYAIDSVTVTMGGNDITASAYHSGRIVIGSVTGNIIITATAVERPQSDSSNLVSAAEAVDNAKVFNGVGYLNGGYASGTGIGTDAACVVTGLIPYDYEGGLRQPLYIKGCTLDTTNSHVRILGFNSEKQCYFQVAAGGTIPTYFSIETLGTDYYRVTPLETIAASGAEVKYLRLSLLGAGEDLIITLNEPIV